MGVDHSNLHLVGTLLLHDSKSAVDLLGFSVKLKRAKLSDINMNIKNGAMFMHTADLTVKNFPSKHQYFVFSFYGRVLPLNSFLV